MTVFTAWYGRGYDGKYHHTPFAATPDYTVCGYGRGHLRDLVPHRINTDMSRTSWTALVQDNQVCKPCLKKWRETQQAAS